MRVVSLAAGLVLVRAGMGTASAKARCAGLDILPYDAGAVDAEVTRVTAALLIASPQVTPVTGAPGLWWVGASGFDSIGGERGLARALLRVARHWHPRARVSIASSCVAARAATWSSAKGGAVFVPDDQCAEYLAGAPLGLIPLDDEIREGLSALGIRTVGAFAALEVEEVERRWGPQGVHSWRLARGDDRRHPVLARAEARRHVHAELSSSTSTMEPILFLVRGALERLVTGLISDARAAATVAITLTLDDGRGALPSGGPAHTVTREVRMARPVARVAPLLEHCRALLEKWTLDARVGAVDVAITASAPLRGEQGDLLQSAWRDPAAIEAALDRLRAELGPNVVVHPVSRDEHRMEKAGVWEEEEGAASGALRAASNFMDNQRASPSRDDWSLGKLSPAARSPQPAAPSALRLLETPERIELELDDHGAPALLYWRGRHVSVTHADGPERLSGDWWKDSYRREYWRCRDADNAALLLYIDHEATPPAWYVQGWYD